MISCNRFAVLLVTLALIRCTQEIRRGKDSSVHTLFGYTPYSPENNGNIHDSGGGGDGSGSM